LSWHRGRVVLASSMEDYDLRFSELLCAPDKTAEARALAPLNERQVFGKSLFIYDRADRTRLAALGEVRTPSVADLFVAMIGGPIIAVIAIWLVRAMKK